MIYSCSRLGPFSPAGGLCLSPTDLTKWLYFVNTLGTTPSKKRLVSSFDFMEMTSSKVALDFLTQLGFSLFDPYPQPSYTAWYGMGWFGRFYRGQYRLFKVYSITLMFISLVKIYRLDLLKVKCGYGWYRFMKPILCEA